MGPLVPWLFVAYAFVLGIGATLFWQTHLTAVGLAVTVGVPIVRIALRFRDGGGYRLARSQRWGSVAETGGIASRTENPLWFEVCVAAEIGVVLTLWGLFFLVPVFEGR
jgi:hypothetical protein